MAEGKWISGLKATTPAAEAARHVLEVRLGVVQDALPRALHDADKDPEHVHQLRVATRRAGAALWIFEDTLRRKAHARARKTLRNLRRAAGDARDWDVFLESLTEHLQKAKATHRAGFDFLTGYAFSQRRAAQERLTEVGEAQLGGFKRFISRTLKAVRPPGKDPVGLVDIARPLLKDLLDDLHKAVQRDLSQYENLHLVRIAGKRLRYAMEVFESCFGSAFRKTYYPAVERVQEILGAANDSHVAAGRLADLGKHVKDSRPLLWRRARAGIERLRHEHERRVPEQHRLFLKWWQEWDRSGVERAIEALLKK